MEESSLQCEQPMPWLYMAMTTYVVIIISQLRLIGKFISDTLWVSVTSKIINYFGKMISELVLY